MGLEQARGPAGANQEGKRQLAIAQRVEELPGGELAVGPDLEIAGSDSAQMHPGIGMRRGIINPR